MLRELTDYKTPTKEQQKIISRLLSIDEDLVTVVVPIQQSARVLVRLAKDIEEFEDLKKEFSHKNNDIEWLKSKIGRTMIVGKGRWNRLLKYLRSDS